MKYRFTLLFFFFTVYICAAQTVKHKITPALKTMMDTASARYIRSGAEPNKLQEVLTFIIGIIKKDSLYYDAWVNKLHVECQLNRFDVGLQTARTICRLFPNEPDALMVGGVMEYHTGHKKEAGYNFNKLLSLDNTILKGHEKDPNYKGVWINKGIVLILLDRSVEGKAIIQKIYDAEKDPYVQSYLGFYIQKSKDEIIADKVPGR